MEERGFFSTGKAGEWCRFGLYLEDMSLAFHNTALVKSANKMVRLQNAYQYNKNGKFALQLIEEINQLKVSLNTKDKNIVQGLSDTDRIRFSKELDNFSSLTVSLLNMDGKLGLSGSVGDLAEIGIQLQVLHDLSVDIYSGIYQDINHTFFYSFLGKVLLILVFAVFCIWFLLKVSEIIENAVLLFRNFAKELVTGKLPSPFKLKDSEELKDISELFNTFIHSLRQKVRFASNLGSESNEGSLEPLSDEDSLAIALLNMEKSLIRAEVEDKKYKEEESKRTWSNEGLATFSEILRMQTDNIVTLSDEIIAHLVKYLDANQGGLFLYNDKNYTDIHLELISVIAFNRKKFTKKRIEIGEGLVGTCVLEKQTIFLTDIPEEYIEISSGLGDASPRSLLIVPLKTPEGIFGVIELASFSVFQPHEIEFVERLAQSIASTFATVKININTSRLLEQSKKQAEEMAQQEEEMRQNLEELQATQEESARREAEINSLIHAVDNSTLVIQTDMEGRILEVNKKFSSILKLRKDELLGHTLKSIFHFNHDTDEYYNLLKDLKLGTSIMRNEEVRHAGGSVDYLIVNYSPILDKAGQPYKILGIASSITETRTMEKMVAKKQEMLNDLEFRFAQYTTLVNDGFIHCELSPLGEILDVNENYTSMSGYHRQELLGKEYRKFLKPDELAQFELIWAELHKDKSYTGVIKRTKPTSDENWLISCFLPFKDQNGNISKIYQFALDITEKRLKYQVLEEANREIERLRSKINQEGDLH